MVINKQSENDCKDMGVYAQFFTDTKYIHAY